MPWLFSYGTLQQEAVQLSTVGRRLAGQADELVGFEHEGHGEPVDVQDSKLSSGPIALQWARGTIKFRKVEIKPL